MVTPAGTPGTVDREGRPVSETKISAESATATETDGGTETAPVETAPAAEQTAPATTAPATTAEGTPAEPTRRAKPRAHTQPPSRGGRLFADRTWWLPWLLGAAVVVVGAGTIVKLVGGSDEPKTPQEQLRRELPVSKHTITYEVKGPSKSPEIRYVTDGTNNTEKAGNVDLPFRKEFTITVGPGPAIVQVLAANGQSNSISCSVSVDGHVVNQNTAPGQYSTVSCSGVVQP
jgi:hypothetical protein